MRPPVIWGIPADGGGLLEAGIGSRGSLSIHVQRCERIALADPLGMSPWCDGGRKCGIRRSRGDPTAESEKLIGALQPPSHHQSAAPFNSEVPGVPQVNESKLPSNGLRQ
jgi:hypothetical protein